MPYSIQARILNYISDRDRCALVQVSTFQHWMCWLWWADRAEKDFKFPSSLFLERDSLIEEEEWSFSPVIPIDTIITNPARQYQRIHRWSRTSDLALIHFCRKKSQPEPQLLEYFIRQGATSFNAALQRAACEGHLETVKMMLERGATDLNSPLSSASIKGYLEVVKLLVAHGATKRSNPFITAACGGHLDVIDYLSQFPEIQTAELNAALKEAALYGHLEAVQDLIRRGATLTHRTLEMALVNFRFPGHRSVVEFLRDELDRMNPGDLRVPGLIRQALERDAQWIQMRVPWHITMSGIVLIQEHLERASQRVQHVQKICQDLAQSISTHAVSAR
jgi:hypothetical protein